MTPEDWQRVKPILAAALELDAASRPAFLKEACADPSLRRQIDSLIATHEQADKGALASASYLRATLTKGTRLGDFEILSMLGAGGMGEVYRARDGRLDRDVAIKVLPRFVSLDPERLRRFEQEAKAAAALNHPNILAVFHMGSYEGAPYLVSELLEGDTLREQVKRGPITPKKAIDYGVQIAHGLAAHEKGTVHRDLKPENLFITRDGRVKILDFGLAKLMQHGSETQLTKQTLDTQAGAVLGTVGYMAPEQVRGLTADHRSDMFAFGGILYEMLTGRRAFQKPTSADTLSAILNEDPPPVSHTTESVSPALDRAVHRCLEKNPDQRFQSASDLAFALEVSSDISAATRGTASPAQRAIWKWLAGAGATAALLSVGAFLWYPWSSRKLTEKDTIVLADFTNSTADPVFDDTLKQALGVALRQSPFLSILPDDNVASTLKLMTRATGTALTPEVASEVCQRSEGKAYIGGSIIRLGNHYVVGLKALNCQNGEVLAQEQVTATAKEKVLDALGDAAGKLRRELGESLATLQKFDVPLQQATTPSLEALKNYSIGRKVFAEGIGRSKPYYLRAVELDPNFARAYAALAIGYRDSGEIDLSRQNAQRAYDLKDRCTEPEKLLIEGRYYALVTGELEKAIAIFEVYARTYPRDATATDNLAACSSMLGQYDKCVAASLVTNRNSPEASFGYGRTMYCYAALNRFQEAKATYEQALAHKADGSSHWTRYRVAFLEDDQAEMDRQVSWAGNSEQMASFLHLEAKTAAFVGKMRRARDLFRLSVERAQRGNQSSIGMWKSPLRLAGEYQAQMAGVEAEVGNARSARQLAATALKVDPEPESKVWAAIALARAGDPAGAQKVVDRLKKQFPLDTIIGYGLETSSAAIDLSQNHPETALQSLEPTYQYEYSWGWDLYAVYLRGLANLQLHRGKQAAADFQEILDHRGIVGNDLHGALAHLGMARACVLSGDTARARTAYQDFLTLWKDADPDIPILKEAKAEFAKLQ